MSYVEQLISMSNRQAEQQQFASALSLGLPQGMAYSSLYPEWEINTPQHQSPNPYSLAQMGYRTNELVFTCIQVRSDSVSEAALSVFDNQGETPEEIKKHKIRNLLRNPLPNVSEQFFWKVTETYLNIAGFCAWEKQRNNLGEVVGLWPMRPDWCSFLRGQQKPIRAIRYQPSGLPYLDIEIENILYFAYFDPLYPLLKPFSPTMAALNMTDVDNNMTKMINTFIKKGAFLGGILSTENQVLQEAEARVYKDRWRDTHGGADNAGDIAVLGKGLKFQTTANTFRDMVFPEVDARSEARITMTFRVPPMLIGAKIGVDRSTYTNYPEARKGFYEGPITSEWNFLASVLDDQLLPEFETVMKSKVITISGRQVTTPPENSDAFFCQFDTSNVKALQEDRTAKVDRGVNMYKSKVAKLNEARAEIGLDPITKKDKDGNDIGDMFFQENKSDVQSPMLDENGEVIEGQIINGKKPAAKLPAPVEPKKTDEEIEAEESEEKKYKTFAKKRIKEHRYNDLYEYEFKFLSEEKQKKLIEEYEAQIILAKLEEAIDE